MKQAKKQKSQGKPVKVFWEQRSGETTVMSGTLKAPGRVYVESNPPAHSNRLVDRLIENPGKEHTGEIVNAVRKGLPFDNLERFQKALWLSKENLAEYLCLSRSTLERRRHEGRLDSASSDRMIRFVMLYARAIRVLETPENARQWLRSPQRGLGGATPLDYAMTEIGASEVNDLLGRIEEGVFW